MYLFATALSDYHHIDPRGIGCHLADITSKAAKDTIMEPSVWTLIGQHLAAQAAAQNAEQAEIDAINTHIATLASGQASTISDAVSAAMALQTNAAINTAVAAQIAAAEANEPESPAVATALSDLQAKVGQMQQDESDLAAALTADPTVPTDPAPEPSGDAGNPPSGTSSGADTTQSAASGDPGASTGDPAPEGSDATGETGLTPDQVAATEAALGNQVQPGQPDPTAPAADTPLGTEQPDLGSDPAPAATLATSLDPDEVVNDHGSAAAAAVEQSGS